MFLQYSLPYDFGKLEPHIDKLTMETHYTKHHAGYTNNLNAAIEKDPSLGKKTIEQILGNLDGIADDGLRTTIRNNGGGFYNHNLYFSTIAPDGSKLPTGVLSEQIKKDFGSLDSLKDAMGKAALSRFGSGWAFLSVAKDGKLSVASYPNQDNPLMDKKGITPILGIDVWEHAYYLKYKNLRGDYVKAFWEVVDWDAVGTLFNK
ncbi:MAG: superoxide dismutase [Sphaerochaeta sp.]|nr:superoxide dismutase [Sphaerochaeta sp.]